MSFVIRIDLVQWCPTVLPSDMCLQMPERYMRDSFENEGAVWESLTRRFKG